MTVYILQSATVDAVAIQQLPTNGDVIFVGEGIVLGNTTGAGLLAEQSSHTVLVYGTVAANLQAVDLGYIFPIGENEYEVTGLNTLRVGEHGHLQSFNSSAVALDGYGNTVINAGLITTMAGAGIEVLHYSTTTQSTINNSGTIEGQTFGIFHSFGSTERMVLTNSGIIRGIDAAYADFASAERVDQVFNTGSMIGDVLLGGGNDVYAGSAGRVTGVVSGGTGADSIHTGAANDRLLGGEGNDTLNGGGGTDTMTGGNGDDIYFVDNAGDVIVEGVGVGSGAADRVAASVSFALAADDSIEIMTTTSAGGTAAINLTGNEAFQAITGNAGANVLSDGGGFGRDRLTGLGGNDTYVVRSAATTIVEGAGQGTADRVAAGISFTLAADDNIEVMTTSSAAGTTAINLTGNALAQTITGNAGANVLDGKAGNDTMSGLGGADDFVFSTTLGTGNIDRITDFAVGVDDILLESAIFTAIGASLSASEFRIGAAVDANDFLLYNAATGALTYDSNGNAAGGATQFAILQSGLALTAADFGII